MEAIERRLPASASEQEVLLVVEELNLNDAVDGILVQLPLPKGISPNTIAAAIDPAKDVDALHPNTAGKLLLGTPTLAACTPLGVMEILDHYEIEIEGASAVVIGRSNLVGKPVAIMLLEKSIGNATVTVVHTGTRDLAAHCRRADILIVAAGVPDLVKPEWIKPGACVIDVGVNRVGEKISEKTGKKIAVLRGDVDFEKAVEVAGAITPVPGGVGPMTIAMLMRNTLRSLEHKLGMR
jgi:methylenetetrahydrofolate dehydrogenase (NADP+)/methenyltetrahydrofolate cyclohydrolase